MIIILFTFLGDCLADRSVVVRIRTFQKCADFNPYSLQMCSQRCVHGAGGLRQHSELTLLFSWPWTEGIWSLKIEEGGVRRIEKRCLMTEASSVVWSEKDSTGVISEDGGASQRSNVGDAGSWEKFRFADTLSSDLCVSSYVSKI